jgi:hypothetical protein
MQVVADDNISRAWLEALSRLAQEPDGKAIHLAVCVRDPQGPEDKAIRGALDSFIAKARERRPRLWPVNTVANTIFPAAFYQPDGEDPRARLYELHGKAQRIQDRMGRDSENYFNRLVAYPVADSEPFNQLEYIVDRLINQRKPRKGGRGGALSSAYEAGLTAPNGADLRVQAPGQDRNTMGFPCLSHISFTLEHDRLNLAALYRNQYFVARAYGNYLGLARIGAFVAREVGVELGEIVCLATHADAEFGEFSKRAVEGLVQSARDTSDRVSEVSV